MDAAALAKKGEVTYLPQTPPHNPVDSVTAQYLEMVAVHAPALQVEEILPSRYTVQPESGTALQAFSLALGANNRLTQDNNSIQGSVSIIAEQGWEALGIPAEPTAPLEERVTSLLHILGAHAVKAQATAQAYSINVDGFSDPLFKTQPSTMMAILTAFEAQLRIGLESVVRKAMEAANSSSSSSSGSMGASGSALRAAGQHAIRVGCATTVDRMVQSVHFQHITGKRVPLQEAKLDPLAVACSATGRPLFLSTPQQMRDEHVARHSQAQILLGDNHSVVLTALGLATAPPLAVGTMSLRLSAGKRPEYPTPPLTAAQASYTLIAAGIASLSTDFNPLGKPLPTLTSLPPLDKTTARASMAVLAVEAFAAHLGAGAKPLREAMPAEEQEDSLENLLDGLESISAEQVTASLIPQAGSYASVGSHAGTNKGKGPLQATGPQRPAPPPQAPASPEEAPVNPFTAALQANKTRIDPKPGP
ncbi:hypothetical protein V8C86DRAFT_3119251 [Haematococcus lacustris]